MNLLADGGYVNGEQIHACEEAGIRYHISMMAASNQPEDERFHREKFLYNEDTDSYTCPMGNTLSFRRIIKKNGYRVYKNYGACKACCERQHCTKSKYRQIDR